MSPSQVGINGQSRTILHRFRSMNRTMILNKALTNVRIELQRQKRVQKLNDHEIKSMKAKHEDLLSEIATHRGRIRQESRQFELIKQNFDFQLNHLRSDLENSVPKAQWDQLEAKLDEKTKMIREMSETNSNTKAGIPGQIVSSSGQEHPRTVW